MPLGVGQGVQHPGVLAGSGQFQLVGEFEHHRPVPLQVAVQQHLPVVAVVRGDLLDLLVLLFEAAEGVHSGGHRAKAPGLRAKRPDQRQQRGRDPAAAAQQLRDVPGGGVGVQALQGLQCVPGQLVGPGLGLLGGTASVDLQQQGAVVGHQRLHDRLLVLADLLQLVPGLLHLDRNALAEHRRQVVPRPHPGLVRQAGHHRDPLDHGVVPQHPGIGRRRLPGEVGDLPRRHSA